MAVTYESVASASSATVSAPSGLASGDLLVALVASVGAKSSLSGWTEEGSATNGSFYFLTALTKIAGGSEPADYTFASAGVVEGGILLRVTGHDPADLIDGSVTGASGSLAAPGMTTTVDGALLAIAGLATASIDPDAAMTERAEVGPTASFGLYLNAATEADATAGATGTRTQTTAGSPVLTLMLAVRAFGAGFVTLTAPTPDGNAAAPAAIVSTERYVTVTLPTPDGNAQTPTAANVGDIVVGLPTPDGNTATIAVTVLAEAGIIIAAPTPDANAATPEATVTTIILLYASSPDGNAAVPTATVTTERYVDLTLPTPNVSGPPVAALVVIPRAAPPWQGNRARTVVSSPQGTGAATRRATPRGRTLRPADPRTP